MMTRALLLDLYSNFLNYYRTEPLPLYHKQLYSVCEAFSAAHLGFASRRRDPAGLLVTWKVVA